MRKTCIFVFLVAMLMSSAVHSAVPDAVRASRSAVVTIYIYENNEEVFTGSGFIMDTTGKVVTNAHVISELYEGKNRTLRVKMDNGSWLMPGDLLVSDADMDVAIFSVSAKNLPFVKLDRNYVPKEGEDIYVIGSPMGLETSFSSGIISSVRGSDGFLQITAPISPGSSGSPVFNVAGEVIGVATLIIKESQNLNFAVPIKYVYLLAAGKKEVKAPPPAVSTSQTVKDFSKAEGKSENSDIERSNIITRVIELIDKGNYKEADDITTKALKRNQDALLYYLRACVYMSWITALEKTKYDNPIVIDDLRDRAVKDLKKAIELKPDAAFALYELAKIMHDNPGKDMEYPYGEDQTKINEHHQKRRQYNVDILKHINKAIYLDPAKDEYYSLRSFVYSSQGDDNMAIKDISSAISLNPKLADYYFRRALLYCDTQQKALARNDYLKAMDISGDDDLNFIFTQCFDNREKVDIYSELISRHNNNANFYYGRANVLKDLGQNEKALADINISIKLKKRGDNVLVRGRIYQALGKYQNAINDYSDLLSGNLEGVYVNRYDLLRSRAICHYAMGNIAKAFSDMDDSCKATDYNKTFGESPCEMAEFLRKELLRGTQWVMLSGPSLFNRDAKRSFLYDRTSIQKKPNGNYTAWFRHEDSKDSEIESLKRSGFNEYNIKKYDNYSHTLFLYEINCPSKSLGTVSYHAYDSEGHVIDRYSNDTVELTRYLPDSLGESAYKAICEKSATQEKAVKGKGKKKK